MGDIILILLILVLGAISGGAKGVMDTLQFHYDSSIFCTPGNQSFWNPKYSWRNKYKNVDWLQPKFFLSTTLLVWTTDGWHLFQMVRTTAMLGALYVGLILQLDLFWALVMVVSYKVAFGGMFTLLYKRLLLRAGLTR